MQAADLEGIYPAVIVPMRSDFSIDFDAYRRYLGWIATTGSLGVAVNVDTGEGPYLSLDERVRVIAETRAALGPGMRIIAGCGGPATAMAVANAVAARDAGADALLVFPTPAFLNDPLDPLIAYDYHKAIAEASGLPIVLFQLAPLFGGVNYPDDTLEKLLGIEQVIGMKDASFDSMRFCRARDIMRRQERPLTLMSGNDNFLLESFLLGARGGLLGYGAAGAQLLVDQLDAVRRGDFADAVAMQPRVQGFCDYIYGAPIGDYRARSKVALVHMGLLDADLTYVRPPYRSLWNSEREPAAAAVARFEPLRKAQG